jgi:hypothetical protein
VFNFWGDNAELGARQLLLLNLIAVLPPCQRTDGRLEKQAYLHVRAMAVHLDCHWINVGIEKADVGAIYQIMGDR